MLQQGSVLQRFSKKSMNLGILFTLHSLVNLTKLDQDTKLGQDWLKIVSQGLETSTACGIQMTCSLTRILLSQVSHASSLAALVAVALQSVETARALVFDPGSLT